MAVKINRNDPSCHCHYRVVTDGATFRSVYGYSPGHALQLFRELVRNWLDDGIVAHLPDGYLANRRTEFVRCPSCS
jgi:hypothetical protein